MKAIGDLISGLSYEPKPPGAGKVEGYEYRIVYVVEDEVLTVVIIRIGQRRESYGRL
jgi:mRNA-degrading endonuclease RelE of RelBE toxin-antitoxin system